MNKDKDKEILNTNPFDDHQNENNSLDKKIENIVGFFKVDYL